MYFSELWPHSSGLVIDESFSYSAHTPYDGSTFMKIILDKIKNLTNIIKALKITGLCSSSLK